MTGNIMNKQFEYRGYNFNIKVELNTKAERHPNGKKWHTVTVNCMDKDNYYKKREVEDDWLTMCIESEEIQARRYVNEIIDGKPTPDKRLSQLGFV
jgi:hypothetical protein